MNYTRFMTKMSPIVVGTQQSDFNETGAEGLLKKLSYAKFKFLIHLSPTKDVQEIVNSLLHKQKMSNGWEIIEENDDWLKLFILSQVLHNEMEQSLDEFQVHFDFPDQTDLVKILWKDGNAIGFYSVKIKDSIVFDTMESYGMTTLDTAYIRKTYRKKGFGLSILEDIAKSFPKEDIGISTPVSPSMYYVVFKFLQVNPSFRTRLWEISGVGSEGNRKLIYFTLKKLFNF